MANPYLATGIARGLGDAEERYRQRKLQDEDRAAVKLERERRNTREDTAGLRDAERFGREQKEWGIEDENRGMAIADKMDRESLAIEDRARGLRKEKLGEVEHGEDRARLKKVQGQQDYGWAQDKAQADKKLREEGMHDMIQALEGGIDARQVEQMFNSRGELKIKPGSLQYDKATDQLTFAGDGGQVFNGTLKQLKPLFGAGDTLTKLGKDDRLINSKGVEVVGPSGGAGGLPGGQKRAAYSEQVYARDAARVVGDELGLKFDSQMQKFIIPDGMSRKVTVGSSFAGQVVRAFGPRITPQEAGAIAAEAVRELSTEQEARAKAEASSKSKGEQAVRAEMDRIMTSERIVASQKLQRLIERKEMDVTQREATADAPGGDGLADAGKPAAGVPAAPPTGNPAATGAPTRQKYDPRTRTLAPIQ